MVFWFQIAKNKIAFYVNLFYLFFPFLAQTNFNPFKAPEQRDILEQKQSFEILKNKGEA